MLCDRIGHVLAALQHVFMGVYSTTTCLHGEYTVNSLVLKIPCCTQNSLYISCMPVICPVCNIQFLNPS